MAISWVGLRGIQPPQSKKPTANVASAKAPGAVPPEGPERKPTPKGNEPDGRSARPSTVRRRQRALRAYASAEEQASAEAGVLVARVMTAPVLTILHRTTAERALALLRERGVRQAPVVNEQKALIGMISEREILDAYQRYGKSPLPTVEELMRPGALSATTDTPLREVARELVEQELHCLVVISRSQRIVGLVTIRDILRLVVERSFMKDAI